MFSLLPSSLPPTVYIISLILLGGRKEKREEYRIKEKGVKRGKGMWRGKGGEEGEEGERGEGIEGPSPPVRVGR